MSQSTLLVAMVAGPALEERTQVRFEGPAGMKVYWLTNVDGKAAYSKTPLETPGRFNFRQGAIYRLKLTALPGQPGLELFPTLEVPPGNARSREFLAHNAVPISLTEDEIASAGKGNLIVKVVYLPDAGGEAAIAGGEDAIRAAQQRGNILLVLRVGNIVDPPIGDKK
jgi:hypothetical protein